MKLKYYLRGLGIGVICTAIIMGIALSGNKKETLTDAEIIERARLLGMIMEEDASNKDELEQSDAEKDKPSEPDLNKNGTEDQKSQNKQPEKETSNDKTDESGKKESNDRDKTEDSAKDQKEEAENGKMIEIEIKQGEFSDVVSQKLFQAGLIPDAEKFNAYMTQKGVDDSLRVGVHLIPEGAAVDEIIAILQEK